ncbi:hypothetical protein D3C84_463470 [compost metagenome]
MKVTNSSQSVNPLGHLQNGRVATRSQSSPLAGDLATNLPQDKLPVPMHRPPPGRYELHRFWAQLGAVQQQATAIQITMRALLQVRQGLRELDRLLAAIKDSGSFKGWTTQLQEQKRLVARIPAQTHYQSVRLLTQEFRPPLLGYQDVREFRINGLNLLVPAGRDEHMELLLLGGRTQRVGLCLRGDSSHEARLRQVGRAFARLGIRSHQHGDGGMVFSVPIEQWKAVNGQLYLRGGGVRIPTGEPIKLKLEPDISWRELSHWKLADKQDLELAGARSIRLKSELESHFFLLQQMQTGWLSQLHAQPSDLGHEELGNLLGGVLGHFSRSSEQRLDLFTTQANLHRENVLCILAVSEEKRLPE